MGVGVVVAVNKIFGGVTERLMVLAWKAMRCNSHAGSNPVSSAIWKCNQSGCWTRLESDGTERLGFDYSHFRHSEIRLWVNAL